LYVLLNIDPTPEPERPHDGTHDRTSELIDTLREQLEAERQAHSEARRLLAAALERIPAIEAPSDERDAQETVEQESERAETPVRCPRPSGGHTEAVVEEDRREVER
jgi:hypothetical protein